MKKLALVAAVVSTPVFADPILVDQGNGQRYGEEASTNTVAIENTVEVLSSRQNAFVCNFQIKTRNNQSDNRVYFTANKVDRRSGIVDSRALVLESRNDGGFAEADKVIMDAFNVSGDEVGFSGNSDYFYTITDIRAEFASLNYGVEFGLRYCIESPFAYVDTSAVGNGYDYGNGKETNWNISGFASVTDLISGSDYVEAADLRFAHNVDCETDPSLVGREGSVGNNPSDFNSDMVKGDVIFGSVNYGLFAFDVNSESETEMKKCVASFEFMEKSDDKRLKGLTEGVKWRTNVTSDYSIGADN